MLKLMGKKIFTFLRSKILFIKTYVNVLIWTPWSVNKVVQCTCRWQGRRRRSGRTASAGPLFWTNMLSAMSLFCRFGSFFFVLTSDFQFIDAIINSARCACHQPRCENIEKQCNYYNDSYHTYGPCREKT